MDQNSVFYIFYSRVKHKYLIPDGGERGRKISLNFQFKKFWRSKEMKGAEPLK
jgi:hypothetical protein